ncbi:MAG TPA: hypothetical protein DCP97_02960 [Ruminococcaceae bacterium]|nr:hypothetical protein [Oscillospiraceae bacterium]
MNSSENEGVVKRVSFTIVKSSISGEPDLPDYITYGLLCKDNKSGQELFVKDISVNMQLVEKMRQIFDKQQPALVHCFDVIEDFLASEY